jgi:hypothetical protein
MAVTKDSFNASKGYREVTFQREANILDFDLNELQAILRYAMDRLGAQHAEGLNLLGSAGFVQPDAGSRVVKVGAGIAVHQGTLIPIPATTALQVFSSGVTTGTQSACVYVEWWDDVVTATTDTSLTDPSFVAPWTQRLRRNVQVKANQTGTALPTLTGGHQGFVIAVVTHNFTSGGTTILASDVSQSYAPTAGELAGYGAARTLQLTSGAAATDPAFDFNTRNAQTGALARWRNAGTVRATLDAAGKLALGKTTTPTEVLDVAGNITATGNIVLPTAGATVDGVDVSAFKTAYDAHTHTFASLTAKPTTLAGYGITDASLATHTHTFASLTAKPTTLAGYGITDASPLVHTHAFSELTAKPTTLAGYGITDAALATHNHDGVYVKLTPGGAQTIAGALALAGALTATGAVVNGAAASNRDVEFQTGGVGRWTLRIDNVVEGGANTGSNLGILRKSDAGAAIDTVVSINRATAKVVLSGALDVGGSVTQGGVAVSLSGHTHTFASLTAKPTTLAGYGITDASPLAHAHPYTSLKGADVFWPTTLAGFGITDAAPLAHTHTFASLTAKPTTLAGYGITDASLATHTHTFASLTAKPTTLAGYGITDASLATHTHTFASLTAKPTTLAGYGITDASPLVHTHDGAYVKLTGGRLTGPITVATTGTALVFEGGVLGIGHSSGSDVNTLITLSHNAVSINAATSLASATVSGRTRMLGNQFDNRATPAAAIGTSGFWVPVAGVGKRALVHYLKTNPGAYAGQYNLYVYADQNTASEQLASWVNQTGEMEDRVPWFFDNARSDDALYIYVVKASETTTTHTFSVSMKAEQHA